VRGAQEYPLVSGCHLGARRRRALLLQPHCQAVQLHAELAQVLVLPHALILGFGHGQYEFHVARVALNQLLYVLLHRQRAVHLLQGLVGPATEVLKGETENGSDGPGRDHCSDAMSSLTLDFVPGRFLRNMVEPSAIFMFHPLEDAMIHNVCAYALMRKSLAETEC